ncbi:hypothetical protein JCM18920_3093 [Cutibacterium acnes JCM 18920]|nr:hypothetical protein JCM18920_3093 [Cutibacterium acnes JCM 18920]
MKAVEAVAGLAGLAVLLGVISTASGWYAVPMSSGTNLVSAWVVAGAGAVLLVVTFVLARLRLNRIRRARLMAGGSLASGMQGAAFALDFASYATFFRSEKPSNAARCAPPVDEARV